MKRMPLKTFVMSMVMTLCGITASATDLFPKLYDSPNIETIYVSKAMMMNSNKSRDILYRQLNIYDSKNLDDLYIYTARTPEKFFPWFIMIRVEYSPELSEGMP